MIGVVLSGGLGTRMGYYTHRVTNKHLCMVFNRAMIEYPISSLVEAGVRDVVVITGGRHSGQMVDFLGDGKEFGLNSLNYGHQHREGGIADALRCAKPFCKGEQVCVILGDNLFEDSLRTWASVYKGGASVLLKSVADPSAFGVAVLKDGKISSIAEKPKQPESDLAIVGAYIFDSDVFDVIETLKPSDRGELEVTDIIKHYQSQDRLTWQKLDGYWTDLGSPDSLLAGANFIQLNYEKFSERFKLFNINLALPLNRKDALEMVQELVDARNYGEMETQTVKSLRKHVAQIDKWSVK